MSHATIPDHCCEAHRRHNDAPCPRWHWDTLDQRPELGDHPHPEFDEGGEG